MKASGQRRTLRLEPPDKLENWKSEKKKKLKAVQVAKHQQASKGDKLARNESRTQRNNVFEH